MDLDSCMWGLYQTEEKLTVIQKSSWRFPGFVVCSASLLSIKMRPSGMQLYKRVCPSVCLSICPSVLSLRLCKNLVSRLFLATVRSYTESNDRQTCFESLLHYSVVKSVCSSICLSIYVTCSLYAETQSWRIVARSGLFSSVYKR